MIRILGVFAIVAIFAPVGIARTTTRPVANAPIGPTTKASREAVAACNQWLKSLKHHEDAYPDLIKFEKFPDADLALLEAIDANVNWDYALHAELGKLNTQRTFDILLARLNGSDKGSTDYIAAYPRPEATTFLLARMKTACWWAAPGLEDRSDPRIDPALLEILNGNNIENAITVASVLGHRNSAAGLIRTLHLLDTLTDQDYRRAFVEAVGTYRRKEAVVRLLKELTLPNGEAYTAAWELNKVAAITEEVLGPAPETTEQWKDWWVHADPLLTDALELKPEYVKPEMFQEIPSPYHDSDYGTNPKEITFRVSVDEAGYRVGDPIRLTVEVTNASTRPYSVIEPNIAWPTGIPGEWYLADQWDFELKRLGNPNVIARAHSDAPLAAGAIGPPPFVTLRPGQIYRDTASLTQMIPANIALPLREGEYEINLVFDSKTRYGSCRGIHVTHEWKMAPVRFQIFGKPLQDSAALLRAIAKKADMRWLEADLVTTRDDRREKAWKAIAYWGDSRLAPFVEKFKKDHPDYSNADSLQLPAFERPDTTPK